MGHISFASPAGGGDLWNFGGVIFRPILILWQFFGRISAIYCIQLTETIVNINYMLKDCLTRILQVLFLYRWCYA